MDSGAAGDGPMEGTVTPESASGTEIDEPVFMKENVRLEPFKTQILECRTKPLLGESTHVMVTPLKAGKLQLGGSWPLPLGLYVLHAYTRFKMSSSKVSVMVRNMLESPVFLKKGVQVVQGVSTSPVPPAELSPEMEAALGTETMWEPMSVTTHQDKLHNKLNVDNLSNWTPWNVAAAKELILAFQDIFALDGN